MPSRDTRKISEMRNLGPACEADFRAAGINDAQSLIELGVEGAFVRMLEGRRSAGRSAKCCNAAYLYAIHGAIHDIDWTKLPAAQKDAYKMFAAELRESGRYA